MAVEGERQCAAASGLPSLRWWRIRRHVGARPDRLCSAAGDGRTGAVCCSGCKRQLPAGGTEAAVSLLPIARSAGLRSHGPYSCGLTDVDAGSSFTVGKQLGSQGYSTQSPTRASQWGWHRDGPAWAERAEAGETLTGKRQEALKLALETLNKGVQRPRLPSAKSSSAVEEHLNSASRVYSKLDSARAFATSASRTDALPQSLAPQSAGQTSHAGVAIII